VAFPGSGRPWLWALWALQSAGRRGGLSRGFTSKFFQSHKARLMQNRTYLKKSGRGSDWQSGSWQRRIFKTLWLRSNILMTVNQRGYLY
jgi:hypothetical protein